ncbi:MAG: hypothetical protein LBC33_01415, partial [Mycoplasmataceae bacterium]|nr:hypothetical protein [Mycoplasmataceae bacterium]
MQLKKLALVGSGIIAVVTAGVLSTNCGSDIVDVGTFNKQLVSGNGASVQPVADFKTDVSTAVGSTLTVSAYYYSNQSSDFTGGAEGI